LNKFLENLKNFVSEEKSKDFSDDYQSEPERFVIFYDGDIFRLKNVQIQTDREGRQFYMFQLKPTLPGLIVKNRIKEEEYDTQTGFIKKIFPVEYCHCLNIDPENAKWLIHCDWNGNPKDVENQMINELRKRIQNIDQQDRANRIKIAEQNRIIRKMSEEPDYLKKRLFKEMKELKGLDEEEDVKPQQNQFGVPAEFFNQGG